jgi:hypothetical protein
MTATRHIARLVALLAAALLTFGPATAGSAGAPAAAAPIRVPFDHFATGFELDGVHRDLPCEACHLNAVFKGTPRQCGTCHVTGSVFNAMPKVQNHIQSTNNCAACHDTLSFRPYVHFDHGNVLGTCASCHNGTVAQGEGPTHPATSQACEACHTVMSWNPPKAVDHTQIPLAVAGYCIICHNGKAAAGKPASHIPTSLECGDCHLTTNWLGATFNHTGIVENCYSCHNGARAVGKQGSHMPTSNICEACHRTGLGTATPSWVPSLFDHTQMAVSTCATCHNGTTKITTGFVSGMPANHVPPIPARLDCSVCHGNTPAAETWTVLAASIATLHTGLNVNNCVQCHGGESFAGVPAPYTPMSVSGVSPTKLTPLSPPHIPLLAGADCSACHGAAYTAGGFGPATAMTSATHAFVSTTCDTCHEAGSRFYTGSGTPLQTRPADHLSSGDRNMAGGDCSLCHTTANWNSNALPAGHLPNPSNLGCPTCHTSAPADYTTATLAANPVLHTGIGGNCGLCHGNTTTALTWANNFTPKDAILAPPHIPYAAGTDCSACHTSTTYAPGTFGPMNMTPATHGFVATTCNTCHEAGLSFTMGAASPGLQNRPADHTDGQMAAPNDCSICHTTANWNSSFLPAGHMPNPGNQACAACHVAIGSSAASYATLASIAVLHTGISGNCGLCHGTPSGQLQFYNNNDNPLAAVLKPAHIPYLSGTDCSNCHTPNYVTGGFGPMNMSPAKHAFVPTSCDSCHEAGLSFYQGAASTPLQGRPADHTAAGGTFASSDCSACHTPADWSASVLPPGHMPNPGSQTCATCHTAIGPTFASYATLAPIPVLHTGISGNCALCHGSPSSGQLQFYNNNDNPLAAVLKPAHIPYNNGTDCSSCHATNYVTGGFGPMNMTPAKHAFVPASCDTCHEAGLSFYQGAASTPLQGRPADHTAAGGTFASSDCSACHTPADWSASVLPPGHMPNPGSQTCATCHTAIGPTFASYATLAPIPVLHTGISGNCALCHGSPSSGQLQFYNNNDNPKAAALNPAHIPYNSTTDCSACHAANYTSGGFGPMNMTPALHAFVSATCDTCHEAGLNFTMGTASPGLQGRPADHTAAGGTQATGDCSGCHTPADWSASVLPTGHMPNPGNQACATCHTAIGPTFASYATLAPIPVLHTGISGNCALCHGSPSSGQLQFYNNNDNPLAAVLKPAHIPYNNGADCSSCHATNYASGGFGPMNMTAATHAFVPTTCDTCHEAGLSFYLGSSTTPLQTRPNSGSYDHVHNPAIPAMTTGDCSQCHVTSTWVATALPSGHMPNPAGQPCTVCHTAAPSNYKLFAGTAGLHTGITAATGCGQCHGGASQLSFYNNDMTIKAAASLSPAHIPAFSGEDCGACHALNFVSGGFGPMNMTQATHNGVGSSCNGCHEKGLNFYMGAANPGLQGRPADHTPSNMATPNDCSTCHTTANWNSSVLPTGHMPNPAGTACATCHTAAPSDYTTTTLATHAVLHTGISGNCGLCHGNTTTALTWAPSYTPKDAILAPAHIQYAAGTDCSACHASSTYAAGTFGPMNMTPAKHAFVSGTCNTCHEAGLTFTMGSASPGLQGRPADHSAGNRAAPNDCSACHTTANWNSTTLPTGHLPNPANAACTTCHTAAPSDYTTTTLATNAVLHGGISGNCGLCHGNTTTALTWANNYTPKDAILAPAHIPYAAGTDCSSCHSSTTYAAGTFGPMNMTPSTHNFVSGTCNTCHEAGRSFTMGSASPGLQGRPADHTLGQMGAPTDCSQCHTTANWNSSVLPTGHMPNPASQPCSTCHASAPADYTPGTLAPLTALHTGIGSNCGLCHGNTTTALTFYNNYTPKDAVLSPSHIPYLAGTDCGPCHSAQALVTRTFGPMNMTQATHTYVPGTCNTCHEAGLSFYLGAASPGLQGRPADHTSGQMVAPNDCSLCHTTANWNSNTMPSGHMPNPANAACAVCHTTAPADYTTKTLATNSILHTGIAGNCGQCHGSASNPLTWYSNFTPKDAVLSPSHIPYTSGTDCSSCHSSATYAAGTFGPMNMTQATHKFVPGTCNTCHEAGLSFYIGSASPALQGRPADHNAGQMAAPNDCSICHTTANWNSTVLPTGHMPNPANSACTVCHTTAPADYSTKTLAANATLHTGISGGCISCHGAPNAAAPVFYLNYTPKDAILSPVHIPTGATPCEDCHSKTTFTTFGNTTMTSAKHTSMFAYIGNTCDACHNKVTPALSFFGVNNLQTRPGDHNSGNKLTKDCSSCHNPSDWGGGAQTRKVTKAATAKTTAVTAVAAPGAATAARTGGGAAARFALSGTTAAVSHAGVTSDCASCHNGVLAPGKGTGHVASNSRCENCHTVNAWLPARFDHQGVTAACRSCHNGAIAPGTPARHIQSTEDCSACHGTLAWLPARFAHTGLAASCGSCHNGVTATGKQATHIPTVKDCASCHDTLSWTDATPPQPALKPLLRKPGQPARPATGGRGQ